MKHPKHKCRECDRRFSTTQGRSLHEYRAHGFRYTVKPETVRAARPPKPAHHSPLTKAHAAMKPRSTEISLATPEPIAAQVLSRYGRFEKMLQVSEVIAILTGHRSALDGSIEALRKVQSR